jgi:hypothetical protein
MDRLGYAEKLTTRTVYNSHPLYPARLIVYPIG